MLFKKIGNDIVYIPTSPRPSVSSPEQHTDNVIDNLLKEYRTNKQRQVPDPVNDLIFWIKANCYDDCFELALSEQPESVRADLYKELFTICINEKMHDTDAWNEIFRAWSVVPSNTKAQILHDIVQGLGTPSVKHEALWAWVWSEGRLIDPSENRSAFLLQVAKAFVESEQYGLLVTMMDSELRLIGYADRYFSPETHPLSPSCVGAAFWSDLLSVMMQIPKVTPFLLPVLSRAGVLLNELKIEDPLAWKNFVSMLTSLQELDTVHIEKFINIGRQTIQDPTFWTWIIKLISIVDINQRYGLAKNVASGMGHTRVKDSVAWTMILDVLRAVPPEMTNSTGYKGLLGQIIASMGAVLVTSPTLWHKVMDGISVDATSWNSTQDCGLQELTSKMYQAKVTNQDLSFRLIKLHAAALFQHLSACSTVNYSSIMKETALCTDVSTLVKTLLNQALPVKEKSQLLQQVSRGMGYAIDDMALWKLLVTLQVQGISGEAPCAELIAQKYYVTDLVGLYGKSGKTFDLMMQSAIKSGRWSLSDLEQVEQYRKEVQEAAPNFPWEKLFNAEKGLGRREFCTFIELGNVSHALVTSIQSLAALVRQLPQAQRLPFQSLMLLHGTLTTLLQQGKGNTHQINANRGVLAYLVRMTRDQAGIHPSVTDAITQLRALNIDNDELKTACGNVMECCRQLIQLIQTEDFIDRYGYCDFYTCEVLDKEAASALLLGNAVSCCLATDGGSFAPEMINRLTHPAWVPVVVRDYKRDYVAVAWCAIAHDGETRQIYLVEDFADIAPRFSQKEIVRTHSVENRSGNHIIKQLHEYVRDFASHLEMESGPLIGKQARGRMEKFDAFAREPEAYFLKPKLEFLCNPHSTGDNIQHVGVAGLFF